MAVVFDGNQQQKLRMIRFRFDNTDYSVVVKNRAPPRTRGGARFIGPVDQSR